MPSAVKVEGVWHTAICPRAKVGGIWSGCGRMWIKKDGQWTVEGVAPTPPSPGTYVLSPSSSYLPMDGTVAWAMFNTGNFQGYISEVKARISWTSLGSANTNVNGRESGTYYRRIDADLQWANRTIDHDISQGVGEFNAGSASGYTLTLLDVTQPGLFMNAMALTLVVA